MEVARLREDNERLLDRILNPPKTEERTTAPGPTTELRPRQTPWRVRQQMLEAEDRERAKLMAEARKNAPTSTEELEKEMKIAESTRESEGQNSPNT